MATGGRLASIPTVNVHPEEARRWLLYSTAADSELGEGPAGLDALYRSLGIIQLDPIDRAGTSPELVAWARVSGLRRGELFRYSAGRVFEHFAKERCLIDARFFPYYRDQALETPWWRNTERMLRISESLLNEVEAEVRERGSLPSEALSDRGRAEPIDWGGWKSTSRAAVLAAEVLWTRCRLVVAARDGRGRRLYDLPERALGGAASAPRTGDFGEDMLLERVRVAGLLCRAGGPMWSVLSGVRTDGTVERLLEQGRLLQVQVGDAARPYLALPELRSGPPAASAREPVVLGPLDPLLWDRVLVKLAFNFEYIWEVYKPAPTRRWGYYVCPVLSEGKLIARVEAQRNGDTLEVVVSGSAPPRTVSAALERLATSNGCKKVRIDASRTIPE